LDTIELLNTFIKTLTINTTEKIYTITIDPIGCRDLDDAISFIDENNFIIHIADPNKFNDIINLNTYYDNYTSIYFGQETYHLLPYELSTNFISLIKNQIRPVLSVYFMFDDNNKPIIKNIIRQNIIVNENLSYDEENLILQNNDPNNNINTLFEISKKLESIYYNNKLLIDTHDMIELFMLTTNNKIAEFLINHNITNILYKNCDKQNDEISINTNQQNVSYYDYHNIGHDKLGLKNYVHFTSPIRRTADYIIHQQIISCIKPYNPTFELKDLLHYNNVLQNIKLVSNYAKYIYIANMINNGNIYKCKLLNFNKLNGIFKWFMINYDLKFTSRLCHEDFIINHQDLFDNLKINEIYDIKLYKFNSGKLQMTNIAFEFNL
jgi:exoribonuclease-2